MADPAVPVLTPAELAEIEVLADQAIREPWCCYVGDLYRGDPATVPAALAAYDVDSENLPWPFEGSRSEQVSVFAGDPWEASDAEWIAAARTAVPRLIAALSAALDENQRLRAQVAEAVACTECDAVEHFETLSAEGGNGG